MKLNDTYGNLGKSAGLKSTDSLSSDWAVYKYGAHGVSALSSTVSVSSGGPTALSLSLPSALKVISLVSTVSLLWETCQRLGGDR